MSLFSCFYFCCPVILGTLPPIPACIFVSTLPHCTCIYSIYHSGHFSLHYRAFSPAYTQFCQHSTTRTFDRSHTFNANYTECRMPTKIHTVNEIVANASLKMIKFYYRYINQCNGCMNFTVWKAILLLLLARTGSHFSPFSAFGVSDVSI